MDQATREIERKESISWMVDEIESVISENDLQIELFESIKNYFHKHMTLTLIHERALKRIYERLTDV